jgi:lipopolysaccharide transport system permease protein
MFKKPRVKSQNTIEKELIIEPIHGLFRFGLCEVLQYRELLYFLTWRDLVVRYKQTVIGVLWAILQPFLTMITFSIFFGRYMKVPSEGIPYPIFSYSGLLLWIFFSSALTNSGNSLIGNSNLITKVYFPRSIIPLSSTIASFVDYFIALGVLIAMMFYYGVFPKTQFIFLPIVLLSAFISTAGFGLWLSALNVKYRDIRYAIPFIIQILLFVTPVIYPVSILPEKFRWILALNPMSGIIDAHRACILGYKAINWSLFLISSFAGALILITGITYFRKTEDFFADII